MPSRMASASRARGRRRRPRRRQPASRASAAARSSSGELGEPSAASAAGSSFAGVPGAASTRHRGPDAAQARAAQPLHDRRLALRRARGGRREQHREGEDGGAEEPEAGGGRTHARHAPARRPARHEQDSRIPGARTRTSAGARSFRAAARVPTAHAVDACALPAARRAPVYAASAGGRLGSRPPPPSASSGETISLAGVVEACGSGR